MLVVVGLVLFVAGGGIAFATVVAGSKNHSSLAAPVSTPAVVVTASVTAGTTGQDLVARGLVSVEPVPAKTYVATDLPNLQGLTDEVLTTSLTKGEAISSTELTPSTTSISVPKNMDAISITTAGVAGLAGYLQPGSNVDLYANINKLSTSVDADAAAAPVGAQLPCTELTMTDIEVLDVSQVVPPLGNAASASSSSSSSTSANSGRTIPGTITLLLAVSPAQAQEITFMTQNETLSVTQTQRGTTPPPIGVCEGTGQYTSVP
jgi:Flp pilus assembly protein CpaB